MKNLIGRRHYPYYHGKVSTYYSWTSWIVDDNIRPGTADWLVGYVPDDTPSGWVLGVHGNPARRLPPELDITRV